MPEKEFVLFAQKINGLLQESSEAVNKHLDNLSGEQLHTLYGLIMDWKYEQWDIGFRNHILKKYRLEVTNV